VSLPDYRAVAVARTLRPRWSAQRGEVTALSAAANYAANGTGKVGRPRMAAASAGVAIGRS
jgi:hypothetical protein